MSQNVHFSKYQKDILYKLENSFGHTKILIFYDLLLNWNIPGIFQEYSRIFQYKYGTYLFAANLEYGNIPKNIWDIPILVFLGYHGILEYSILKMGHTNVRKSGI